MKGADLDVQKSSRQAQAGRHVFWNANVVHSGNSTRDLYYRFADLFVLPIRYADPLDLQCHRDGNVKATEHEEAKRRTGKIETKM